MKTKLSKVSGALLAALFLIPAMSLAGVPPLSGFFAKLGLIRGGLAVLCAVRLEPAGSPGLQPHWCRTGKATL